jgi:hypothetical protein
MKIQANLVNKQHSKVERMISTLLALTVVITALPNGLGFNGNVGSNYLPTAEQDLAGWTEMELDPNLGTIEGKWQSKNSAPMILIDDAHSIPDAQRNIEKIITYLQVVLGIQQVYVEGAAQPLDAQFLKSFPDQKKLKVLLDGLFDSGELTGVNAAAISSDGNISFEGIEDRELYERGLTLYFAAKANEERNLNELLKAQTALKEQKKQIYSKELFVIDEVIESFYEAQINLIELLTQLSVFEAPHPESHLFEIWMAAQQPIDVSLEREVKAIAESMRIRGNQPELNERLQAFNTGALSLEDFALYLSSRDHPSATTFSDTLKQMIERQRRITELKGTALMQDVKHYLKQVQTRFIRTDKEKALNEEGGHLRLLSKLAKLELTFEEWEALKRPGTKSFLNPNIAFYGNTAHRDDVYLERLLQPETSFPTILVTGGFHTQRLAQKLKERDISYVLVRPAIHLLPSGDLYAKHMNGDVSWSDYYKVRDGSVNVKDAFLRSLRDRLLQPVLARHPSEKSLSNLEIKMAKRWRDQIILDLAKKNQVSRHAEYTRFLDELNQGGVQKPEWILKLDQFISGLKKLDATRQVTEQNILKLLQPSNILAAGLALTLDGTSIPFELAKPDLTTLRTTLRSGDVRNEVRNNTKISASIDWSAMKSPQSELWYQTAKNDQQDQSDIASNSSEVRNALVSPKKLLHRQELRTDTKIDRVRADLVRGAQKFIDYVSKGDDILRDVPDTFLLLGNPDFKSILEFTRIWKKLQSSGAEIPIVLAGGIGRGTIPIFEAAAEHYRDQLTASEQAWFESSIKALSEFMIDGKVRPNISETDFLLWMLKKEGMPATEPLVFVEPELSRNTAQNFEHTTSIFESLSEKGKPFKIGVVSSPALLFRLEATAEKKWADQIKQGWRIQKVKTYDLKLDELSDAELINQMGYSIGYPKLYVELHPKLNPFSELNAWLANYMKDVVPRDVNPAAKTTLENAQKHFRVFLDLHELQFDPVRQKLFPLTLRHKKLRAQPDTTSNASEAGSESVKRKELRYVKLTPAELEIQKKFIEGLTPDSLLDEVYEDAHKELLELFEETWKNVNPKELHKCAVCRSASHGLIRQLWGLAKKSQFEFNVINAWYTPPIKTIPLHEFVLLIINGIRGPTGWVLDPTWQRSLKKEEQAPHLPRLFISEISQLKETLLSYGVSDSSTHKWISGILSNENLKRLRNFGVDTEIIQKMLQSKWPRPIDRNELRAQSQNEDVFKYQRVVRVDHTIPQEGLLDHELHKIIHETEAQVADQDSDHAEIYLTVSNPSHAARLESYGMIPVENLTQTWIQFLTSLANFIGQNQKDISVGIKGDMATLTLPEKNPFTFSGYPYRTIHFVRDLSKEFSKKFTRATDPTERLSLFQTYIQGSAPLAFPVSATPITRTFYLADKLQKMRLLSEIEPDRVTHFDWIWTKEEVDQYASNRNAYETKVKEKEKKEERDRRSREMQRQQIEKQEIEVQRKEAKRIENEERRKKALRLQKREEKFRIIFLWMRRMAPFLIAAIAGFIGQVVIQVAGERYSKKLLMTQKAVLSVHPKAKANLSAFTTDDLKMLYYLADLIHLSHRDTGDGSVRSFRKLVAMMLREFEQDMKSAASVFLRENQAPLTAYEFYFLNPKPHRGGALRIHPSFFHAVLNQLTAEYEKNVGIIETYEKEHPDIGRAEIVRDEGPLSGQLRKSRILSTIVAGFLIKDAYIFNEARKKSFQVYFQNARNYFEQFQELEYERQANPLRFSDAKEKTKKHMRLAKWLVWHELENRFSGYNLMMSHFYLSSLKVDDVQSLANDFQLSNPNSEKSFEEQASEYKDHMLHFTELLKGLKPVWRGGAPNSVGVAKAHLFHYLKPQGRERVLGRPATYADLAASAFRAVDVLREAKLRELQNQNIIPPPILGLEFLNGSEYSKPSDELPDYRNELRDLDASVIETKERTFDEDIFSVSVQAGNLLARNADEISEHDVVGVLEALNRALVRKRFADEKAGKPLKPSQRARLILSMLFLADAARKVVAHETDMEELDDWHQKFRERLGLFRHVPLGFRHLWLFDANQLVAQVKGEPVSSVTLSSVDETIKQLDLILKEQRQRADEAHRHQVERWNQQELERLAKYPPFLAQAMKKSKVRQWEEERAEEWMSAHGKLRDVSLNVMAHFQGHSELRDEEVANNVHIAIQEFSINELIDDLQILENSEIALVKLQKASLAMTALNEYSQDVVLDSHKVRNLLNQIEIAFKNYRQHLMKNGISPDQKIAVAYELSGRDQSDSFVKSISSFPVGQVLLIPNQNRVRYVPQEMVAGLKSHHMFPIIFNPKTQKMDRYLSSGQKWLGANLQTMNESLEHSVIQLVTASDSRLIAVQMKPILMALKNAVAVMIGLESDDARLQQLLENPISLLRQYNSDLPAGLERSVLRDGNTLYFVFTAIQNMLYKNKTLARAA